MTGRRAKLVVILAIILASAFGLVGWTQTWFTAALTDSDTVLEVSGQVASPALSALSLAGLALAGALAIAGPVIRVVLSLLAIILGASIALAASLSLGDPVGAVGPAVTESTGIAGSASIAALVESVEATFWPAVTIAAGILLALSGLMAVVTTRRWPGSTRRYRAVRFDTTDDGAERSAQPTFGDEPSARDRAIDEWDDLSRGTDPTDTTR